MFTVNENLKINRTEIANSNVFEVFDVFKDTDWVLDYIEGLPHTTRFNQKKLHNTAKEYSVNVIDRHIGKLQDQLSLLCNQKTVEKGSFEVKYVKIAKDVFSFTQQTTHNGHIGVIHIAENDDTFDLSKNLNYNVLLQHKTKHITYPVQTLHNRLLLFNGNVFNLQHIFKGVDAKYNEYFMCIMYFN